MLYVTRSSLFSCSCCSVRPKCSWMEFWECQLCRYSAVDNVLSASSLISCPLNAVSQVSSIYWQLSQLFVCSNAFQSNILRFYFVWRIMLYIYIYIYIYIYRIVVENLDKNPAWLYYEFRPTWSVITNMEMDPLIHVARYKSVIQLRSKYRGMQHCTQEARLLQFDRCTDTVEKSLDKLQRLQNQLVRVVHDVGIRERHVNYLLFELHWLPIPNRMTFKIGTLCFNALQIRQPAYLADSFNLYAHATLI